MNARNSDNILLSIVLLVVGMATEVLAENTATNPVPPDGAITPPGVYDQTDLYMFLEFTPGLDAVSHTGYFSDTYSDVADRDPAHSLGAPPFPEIIPTLFLVGYDDPAIPPFARASLERGKTYFWCVDAFDGQTTWPGNVWTFTVMPQKAWNPNPPDGTGGVVPDPNITLTWERGDVEDVGYNIHYEMYYGTDSENVLNSTTPSATVWTESLALSAIAPSTKYFWRVDTVQVMTRPPFHSTTIKGDVWTFQTSANTIYVDDDATGANDGSTWPNAYKFLQDALADANASPKPLEIRVAQGTCRPDESTLHPNGTGDREATFQLINGVTLKGGYAGFGQPDPDARDIELYETILSGDLDENDGLDFANYSENCYHVVTGSGSYDSAVLDGFTVSGGNADHGPSPGNIGGGMLNHMGSPTVINCAFVANSGVSGGGMYNWEGSGVRLIDCSFIGNSVSGFGGGMYNNSSSPELINCVFSNNSGGSGGGGMRNRSSSNPTLNSCTFSSNTAEQGGAIANYDNSIPLLTNCTISENRADYGGGMHNSENSSPVLSNCRFRENSAWGGGGMFNDGGSPIISSSIFIGNSAIGKYGDGGGMHNKESNPTLINCTFNGNLADRYGGAMNTYRYATPTIMNCILWGDVPEEIYVYGRAPVVTYSNVQGGWAGEGNFDLPPKFMETSGGGIHLLPDSPCVNAGDPGSVVGADPVDIDGEKRVMLGRVDMGADEFNPFLPEFVVVCRERVERTVFEYECEVVLENISRFAVSDVSLDMAEWSENMTIIKPDVSFGDVQVGPGESATSVDTCTFTVDRSEAIDQAEIIWHVTAELVAGGAKMEYTVSTALPPDPQTKFDGLKDLAENWLWQGTAGAIDADSVPDGTVNLADFAKFADQWANN